MLKKIVSILGVSTPVEEINVPVSAKEQLKKVDSEVTALYSVWNNTNDIHIIDSCILKIQGLLEQRESIMQEIRKEEQAV
jgi:hypothetical protein